MNVAVIGSGMAGLTAARILEAAGAIVTVFDKSKGTGGRLSSRSFEGGWIDHGAPYFSSEQTGFSEFLRGHTSWVCWGLMSSSTRSEFRATAL